MNLVPLEDTIDTNGLYEPPLPEGADGWSSVALTIDVPRPKIVFTRARLLNVTGYPFINFSDFVSNTGIITVPPNYLAINISKYSASDAEFKISVYFNDSSSPRQVSNGGYAIGYYYLLADPSGSNEIVSFYAGNTQVLNVQTISEDISSFVPIATSFLTNLFDFSVN